MTIRIRLYLIALCLTGTLCYGQVPADPSVINRRIIKQANEMGQYMKHKDAAHFIGKLHPQLSVVMGGKEKMIEYLKQGYTELAAQGLSIDSVKCLAPNPIIDLGKEWQTTLTEVLVLLTPKGRLISKSTLIAVSTDKGKTWHFLDTSGKNLQTIQKEYPAITFSDKLIIEPKEKPVFFPE